MKTRQLLLALAGSLAMQMAQAQFWNRLPGGNVIQNNDWLGADYGSTIPLRIQTRANQPIDFSTADLFRARINPKISYPIGPESAAARDGFMLLSGRPDFVDHVKGPFTRLHLADDVGADDPLVYAQQIGYRKWMRNPSAQAQGRLITFTGNSDQAYLGQKYAGDENTDFVIQWSDNPDVMYACNLSTDAPFLV